MAVGFIHRVSLVWAVWSLPWGCPVYFRVSDSIPAPLLAGFQQPHLPIFLAVITKKKTLGVAICIQGQNLFCWEPRINTEYNALMETIFWFLCWSDHYLHQLSSGVTLKYFKESNRYQWPSIYATFIDCCESYWKRYLARNLEDTIAFLPDMCGAVTKGIGSFMWSSQLARGHVGGY